MTERRACKVVGQARSTQRYTPQADPEEGRLRAELREVSLRRPRAGYRMAARCLRRSGWKVNDKRVQRLWREEGLRVPRRQSKRRRMGCTAQGSQRLRAEYVNHVWSYDFVQDRTRDGRRLKMLCVVDEYTRECLAIQVARRMTAMDVILVIGRLIAERGMPRHLRSDNGPEFIAKAVQQWLKDRGVKTLYIEPGSPWQNGFVESFHGRFRDECLNREQLHTLTEARVVIEDYRQQYNQRRPHSRLGYLSPESFAQKELPSPVAVGLRPPSTGDGQFAPNL